MVQSFWVICMLNAVEELTFVSNRCVSVKPNQSNRKGEYLWTEKNAHRIASYT